MDFERLLKPDRYQVFLMSSPASLPLSFARHPWFVVNKKGAVSRYEVIAGPHLYNLGSDGHLYVNALPPWRGLRILRAMRTRGHIWQARLHGVVEGDQDSLARRMADVIESTPQSYPHNQRYAYTGPNSNTYVQWVLDQFPESGLKLPWNAFGKYFK